MYYYYLAPVYTQSQFPLCKDEEKISISCLNPNEDEITEPTEFNLVEFREKDSKQAANLIDAVS